MAKLGAAFGVRTGVDVDVNVLVNKLPDAWRQKTILACQRAHCDRSDRDMGGRFGGAHGMTELT